MIVLVAGKLTILENYGDIANVHLGNGLSIFFWKDKWNIQALENTFQELYSFVKNKSLPISKVFQQDQITTLFHLPLSELVFAQLQTLLAIMEETILFDKEDTWAYILGQNFFSSESLMHTRPWFDKGRYI